MSVCVWSSRFTLVFWALALLIHIHALLLFPSISVKITVSLTIDFYALLAYTGYVSLVDRYSLSIYSLPVYLLVM